MSSLTQDSPTHRPRKLDGIPCVLASTLVALAAACVAFAAAAAAMWGSLPATLAAIDFNAALFEDFLGPYWGTARALADGGSTPAPGYLYPATLAWLLAPFAALAAAGSATVPSIVALWSVAGSLALWVGGVFALLRPRSLRVAALAGVALGLAHAPIHGAYWAQASLPTIGLLTAGVALITKGRPVLAGVAIGLAAALKLHPAIGIVALVVPWRSGGSLRSAVAAAVSAVAFGVLVPMALMGRTAFVEFHRVSFGSLADMHDWVLTKEGGRGSQDFPTVLRRAASFDPGGLSQALGWALAGALLAGAVLVLRRSQANGKDDSPATSSAPPMGPLMGLIALAAIPWAAVSPTWPHGLLWVPAAWWCALHHPSKVGRALAAASFACGSIVALRAFGSPEAYAWFALPAWSAGLALAAIVPAWRSATAR